MHKIEVVAMSKEIDLLFLASSQALSPAPFQAKGGFTGNVETPLLLMPVMGCGYKEENVADN